MSRERRRDIVETNEYGVRCVIGYRKVGAGGTVRIGGMTLQNPDMEALRGQFVYCQPYNFIGDYSATDENSTPMKTYDLQEVNRP